MLAPETGNAVPTLPQVCPVCPALFHATPAQLIPRHRPGLLRTRTSGRSREALRSALLAASLEEDDRKLLEVKGWHLGAGLRGSGVVGAAATSLSLPSCGGLGREALALGAGSGAMNRGPGAEDGAQSPTTASLVGFFYFLFFGGTGI
jgi:hypothetical protein